MLPISKISEGDTFQNPLFPDGVIFFVEEIDQTEKMVKVQCYGSKANPIGKPFWKRNTDRMFSESWRFQ
jgi:hypothetical protein